MIAARIQLSCLIRRVEASDSERVYSVERECFHDPFPQKLLEDLMRTEHDRFFVAVKDGKIIGYAVGRANAKNGHVVSVAVAPRHRRRGVGTALLSAVTHRLIEEGVEQIHLEVRKGNVAAISFYERMGFHVSSEIRRYYSDGEDAWVLKRTLASQDSESPGGFRR